MQDYSKLSKNYRRQKQKRLAIYGIIAVAIAMLFGGIFLMSGRHLAANISSPAPNVWQLQHEQTFVQNSEGTFCIKWIIISPKEFRFFYALDSSYAESLKITASTISQLGKSTALFTQDQFLGQIGTARLGVVHVSRVSNPGQTISLSISFLADSSNIWHLTPLKQLINESHENTAWYGIMSDEGKMPEVVWKGPTTEKQVAAFHNKLVSDGDGTKAYVFLRFDDPVIVTAITWEEYRSITGSTNLPQ